MLDLLVRLEGHRLGIAVFGAVEPPVDTTFVAWLERQGLESRRRLARVGPRPDEHRVRSEDAADFLRRYGHEYAFAWVPAVDPVTGVAVDVAAIAAEARAAGCVVGCDAGAAVGLRQVRLSDWGVDCALSSVSGYLGGFEPMGSVIYLSERHRERAPRAADAPGPRGLASILESVLMVGPEVLEARAGRLATFLRAVVARWVAPSALIGGAEEEGSLWVSVLVPDGAEAVVDELHRRHGVAAAAVARSVVALAPSPLYTTYRDCLVGAAALARVLDATKTPDLQRTRSQEGQ